MVSQSTTYSNPKNPDRTNGPEMAIDKDKSTKSHTVCEDGNNVWYKIEFNREHAVKKVVLVNSFDNGYKARMDGTVVVVLQGGVAHTCGTVSVTSQSTEPEYSIQCNSLWGDGVTLEGEPGKQDACIHMREIQVFETVNIGKLLTDGVIF